MTNDRTQARAGNQHGVARQIFTSISITGTSISPPTMVARAAPGFYLMVRASSMLLRSNWFTTAEASAFRLLAMSWTNKNTSSSRYTGRFSFTRCRKNFPRTPFEKSYSLFAVPLPLTSGQSSRQRAFSCSAILDCVRSPGKAGGRAAPMSVVNGVRDSGSAATGSAAREEQSCPPGKPALGREADLH
jgi:hypothetical protein